jgi:hypothetical protein
MNGCVLFRGNAAGLSSAVVLGFLLILSAPALAGNTRADTSGTCIDHAPNLPLGCVPTGSNSIESLEIRNKCGYELTITNAISSSGHFVVLNTFPITIPSGSSAYVSVEFQSRAQGYYNATLTIDSDDPSNPQTTANMSAWNRGGLAIPDTFHACVDTLAPLDPPYDFYFEMRNTGCAPLLVDAVSLVYEAGLLVVSYPDSLGPYEVNSIWCEGYIDSADIYFDSLLVATHDSIGYHSGGFPIVIGTFQPELPDTATRLIPLDDPIVSSPSGSTQPEEQLFQLRLVNRNGCPVRNFSSDSLLWSFDVTCTFGDTSNVQYEILSPASDENGIIEVLITHPEPPYGCSYSDCCEFTLAAQYDPIYRQKTSSVKTADLNQDNTVDEEDQMILMSNWGTDDFCSDLNSDGIVDMQDVTIYTAHYLETCAVLGVRNSEADERAAVSVRPIPNPFASFTDIIYSVPRGGEHVSLKVFDIQGREVRTLVDAAVESGIHTARWDGFDNEGAPVASGVYFCKLESGDQVETSRLIIMK